MSDDEFEIDGEVSEHPEVNEDTATTVKNKYEDGQISSDENSYQEAVPHTATQKADKKKDSNKQLIKPKVKMKTLTVDGKLVYFCKICDRIFTRRKDKLNHELAHSGETMLTCSECGKEYLHESSLASHMRTHDGDPLFMCDLCPKMFAQSHHLKTHALSHSEPTIFTCKICWKEFSSTADLNHHIKVVIAQEMAKFWCKMCKLYFCRSHSPPCTRRLHAYCCSACHELFYTLKKLKLHMKKFFHFSVGKPEYIEPLTEQELYPDKISDTSKKGHPAKESNNQKKSFQNPVRKRELDENDAPRKKFKLSPRKAFLDDDHSSTSIQESAPESVGEVLTGLKSPSKYKKNKPYCKRCNKSFKDSSELARHQVVVHGHTSVTPTKIPILNRVAGAVDHQSPFRCKICHMGFSTRDQLERHGFKHSGEHMHICPTCGEEFSQPALLAKHVHMHVGDHPYSCSQCGKAFRLKIQLIQHVRLHIVQDANSCNKCPAKFKTRAELHDHVAQAHGESFKCHLCGKIFHLKTRLHNHLRIQHQTTGLESQGNSKAQLGLGIKRSGSPHNKGTSSEVNSGGFNVCIKSEPPNSDCESEQSFCSSFTRESERSDTFRLSSDDSNSFKTAMAKERIRLRRKWRHSQQKLLEQMMIQKAVDKCEITDTNNVECSADLFDEATGCNSLDKDIKTEYNGLRQEEVMEEPEMDLVFELNVIESEADNVLTVYVDLIPKPPCIPECNSPEITDLSLNSKDTIAVSSEHGLVNGNTQSLAQATGCIGGDIKEEEDWVDRTTSKVIMFEFDPEELGVKVEDIPQLSEIDHIGLHTSVTESTKQVLSVKNLVANQTLSTAGSHVISPHRESPSSLAKLQAVFQHSLKYLPQDQSVVKHAPCSKTTQHKPVVDCKKVTSRRLHKPVSSKSTVHEERTCSSDVQNSICSNPSTDIQYFKQNVQDNSTQNPQSFSGPQPCSIIKDGKNFVKPSSAFSPPSPRVLIPGSQSSTKFTSSSSPSIPQPCISSVVNTQAPSASSSFPVLLSCATTCSTSTTSLSSSTSQKHGGSHHGSVSGNVPIATQDQMLQAKPTASVNMFDTSNPLLRDMNMMDLVRANKSSSSTEAVSLAARATPLPQKLLPQPHLTPSAPLVPLQPQSSQIINSTVGIRHQFSNMGNVEPQLMGIPLPPSMSSVPMPSHPRMTHLSQTNNLSLLQDRIPNPTLLGTGQTPTMGECLAPLPSLTLQQQNMNLPSQMSAHMKLLEEATQRQSLLRQQIDIGFTQGPHDINNMLPVMLKDNLNDFLGSNLGLNPGPFGFSNNVASVHGLRLPVNVNNTGPISGITPGVFPGQLPPIPQVLSLIPNQPGVMNSSLLPSINSNLPYQPVQMPTALPITNMMGPPDAAVAAAQLGLAGLSSNVGNPGSILLPSASVLQGNSLSGSLPVIQGPAAGFIGPGTGFPSHIPHGFPLL